jgi:hypothetical protein
MHTDHCRKYKMQTPVDAIQPNGLHLTRGTVAASPKDISDAAILETNGQFHKTLLSIMKHHWLNRLNIKIVQLLHSYNVYKGKKKLQPVQNEMPGVMLVLIWRKMNFPGSPRCPMNQGKNEQYMKIIIPLTLYIKFTFLGIYKGSMEEENACEQQVERTARAYSEIMRGNCNRPT